MQAYLDCNATTQPLPEVIDAMHSCLRDRWANPSSVHRAGVDARHAIELAREQVAGLIGCAPRAVTFTSGGTEAAQRVILGAIAARSERPAIATSALEHSAVRDLAQSLEARGTTVHWLRHHADGVVDLDALDALLAEHGAAISVLSLMWANNETGVIQPIAEVAARCRAAGVVFHTDAVQWTGRERTDWSALGIDALTCSAHKLHGPKGVGAIAMRTGAPIEPILPGGPQELGRRAGTENVPGIVGFGVAAEAARAWIEGDAANAPCRRMITTLERAILAAVPGSIVNAAASPRLWNTTSVAFPGLEAEAILLLLSERGVAASAGAACSSGSLEPSPVLRAMGVPEPVAHGTIRLSVSRLTTADEIDHAMRLIPACIERLGLSSSASVRGSR
ncbi:MAG: aminotransferase class V-fold PLP-dependent enzyme [Phycisphaerae bacterium]|nr:aminotransferase class V-fold PLP-dependent enzyme [Phycisphaerae bacterium]